MTWRKALEGWETKISNCEAMLLSIWPLAKSLMKRDRSKASWPKKNGEKNL
jgi:hypothetical protein